MLTDRSAAAAAGACTARAHHQATHVVASRCDARPAVSRTRTGGAAADRLTVGLPGRVRRRVGPARQDSGSESGVQLERQAAAAAAAAESPATARRPPTLYGGGDGSRSRANTFRRTVAEPRQGRRRTRTRRRVEIYLQSVTGSANTTRAIKPQYTYSYLVQIGGGAIIGWPNARKNRFARFRQKLP